MHELKRTKTIYIPKAQEIRESITPEAEEFLLSNTRVPDIGEIDDIFWSDFLLGAAMWGIYCGCIGAQ